MFCWFLVCSLVWLQRETLSHFTVHVGVSLILGPSALSSTVGSYGFDGCIRDMQFGTIALDLNDNERAKGVVRGCPAKVSAPSFACLKQFLVDQTVSE